MIIDVKSTKADGTTGRPILMNSPSRSPRASPVVLSLLLTGMALYLKSVFPGWGPTTLLGGRPEPAEEKSAPKLALIPSDNFSGLRIDAQPVGSIGAASAR